jgi:predicted nucleotidyltransferase
MISMTRIKHFSQRIAREFKPKRIILFGSHANGRPTPDSDVDMLVVMPFEGRAVEKSVEIRMKLLPDFPLDLLVRTPENIEQRLSMGDFFMHDIIHKGKVLYETHNP